MILIQPRRPLGRYGTLNVSLLERFDSGKPYSASKTIRTACYVDCHPCDHAAPDERATYFFSDRGEYRWDDATATDVAFNYQFPLAHVSVFAQAEILNIFNEQAQIGGHTAVWQIAPFDPFTETPVEGVHWVKGSYFGKATSPDHYQGPRTYRFSVGVRF